MQPKLSRDAIFAEASRVLCDCQSCDTIRYLSDTRRQVRYLTYLPQRKVNVDRGGLMQIR